MGFGPLLEDKLCLIFKLAPSVCRMTFPILASLLVRLVVLLPFQLLRLSRSEERFSRNAETDLVCRLLLEKKKRAREEWFRQLHPDRLGFYSLRERPRNSGGAGARFSCGFPDRLRARDHRYRSVAVRIDLRALS